MRWTLRWSARETTALDFFIGGVGNARWAGTRLAPLLEQAGIQDGAAEVIFWGVDSGPVTVRDNSGVLSAGDTGMGEPDMGGGLDLTVTEQFARSMSVADAMSRDNLLCYEMNDEPLPPEHGFPVRLIAPGWYGVANVKWLTRIEVVDQRWAGRFMARDYVTIREQRRDGETIWTFATVGHDRLKSAPAKVTRWDGGYAIYGAAWGAPVTRVEVQIDDGPWMEASSGRPGGVGQEDRHSSLLKFEGLTGTASHADIPGGSGRSPGASPPRASTASVRARSISRATSSRHRTIPSSPARGPTGRATGRLRAGS